MISERPLTLVAEDPSSGRRGSQRRRMAMLAVIRSNAEKKALDDYHNKVGNDD